MTKAKFPARKKDGSFCVKICVGLTPGGSEDLASQIEKWMREDWMPRNSTWKRLWRTGPSLSIANEETLRWEDEFLRPPEVSIIESSKFCFKLFGKRTKFWRDWLVSRLLPDLREDSRK
jgi:hypothetical protein